MQKYKNNAIILIGGNKLCGTRSKHSLVLLGLFCLLLCSPLCYYSYAEVTLTDEEAEKILNEIQESKKDLETLQSQLETAETQLEDVKNTYNEQKESYEKQLTEAEKKNRGLKTAVVATSSSTVVAVVLFIIACFL